MVLYYNDVDYTDVLYEKKGPKYDDISDWMERKFTLGLTYPNIPYYIDGIKCIKAHFLFPPP